MRFSHRRSACRDSRANQVKEPLLPARERGGSRFILLWRQTFRSCGGSTAYPRTARCMVRSKFDLRAELHYTVGREAEEAGGAFGVAHHRREELLAPLHHSARPLRDDQRFTPEE